MEKDKELFVLEKEKRDEGGVYAYISWKSYPVFLEKEKRDECMRTLVGRAIQYSSMYEPNFITLKIVGYILWIRCYV